MTTAHTSPSAAFLSLPLDCSKEMYNFDMLDALLGAGVPHIVELTTSFLSIEELALAEQVCRLWRDIMVELPVWKYAIQRITQTSPLWKALFERRRWLPKEVTSSRPSNNFYRLLYKRASRDIRSLEENWRRGHYTPTNIQTGSIVWCMQYDSEKIVSGHEDSTIKIWDSRTLVLKTTLVGHADSVMCLQFNEEVVISGSLDCSVKVWNIQTGQMVNKLLPHKDHVIALKFKSELLITATYEDWMFAVWDFKSSTAITLRMVLNGHHNFVGSVDLTDTNIISGSWDGTIKVWNSSTGGLLHTFQHSSSVYCLSCRGSLIVSGCSDGTIRMWDLFTGTSLRQWKGHERTVCSIAIDDQKIVTGGSYHCTVKVWSISAALDPSSSTEALCIATLKEHIRMVQGVQFDDLQIISCGYEGMICIHDFLDPVPVDPVFTSLVS